MQKLEGRNTYTPRGVPQAPGNCGLLLNRDQSLSAIGLKTLYNNPDAALTVTGHTGQNRIVSVVYVQNKDGIALMPCSPAKARHLLRDGKAEVAKRAPFTIRLMIVTGHATQPVVLGVDSGYTSIGLSAVGKDKGLYSAQVNLRTDIVKLLSERRQYRRGRRYRKTWYRKPRFLNRRRPDGWLSPSVQNKLDAHIKAINQVKEILPISEIAVEVAAFDIQKIKNPEISGVDYQNGSQKDFGNVREYVLYRDGHTCQKCKGKSRDKVLEVHHIISRQVDGDRPDNLITLCSACHRNFHSGKINLDIRPSKGFKAETLMSTVRWMLVDRLKGLYPKIEVRHTYGYITKSKRIEAGIPKSHTSDAFVIAGGTYQRRSAFEYLIQQVRKCNRKLFKGERSHIRNTAERFVYGFQRFDKVIWRGIECFISGRRRSGYFALRRLDGDKIHSSARCSELLLTESAKTFLIERRVRLLPLLSQGVSAARV